MASYNGEAYIKEQLESLLKQTYKDWRLLIRDDGSQDSTTKIIDSYCENYPTKIVRIIDDKGNLGYKDNFVELIKHASAEYIMFCDQDDIWLPDKIEKTYEFMRSVENQNADVPIIVHTNLYVYHEGKRIRSTYHRNDVKIPYTLRRALMFSLVVECTAMLNSFYKKIEWEQEFDTSHGYFLTLYCMSCGGTVAYLDIPTILYRQHGNNQIGVSIDNQPLLKIKKLLNVKNYVAGVKRTKEYRDRHENFIMAFYVQYYGIMSDWVKDILDEQCVIKEKDGLRCVIELRRKGYLVGDWYVVCVTALYYLFLRDRECSL